MFWEVHLYCWGFRYIKKCFLWNILILDIKKKVIFNQFHCWTPNFSSLQDALGIPELLGTEVDSCHSQGRIFSKPPPTVNLNTEFFCCRKQTTLVASASIRVGFKYRVLSTNADLALEMVGKQPNFAWNILLQLEHIWVWTKVWVQALKHCSFLN